MLKKTHDGDSQWQMNTCIRVVVVSVGSHAQEFPAGARFDAADYV